MLRGWCWVHFRNKTVQEPSDIPATGSASEVWGCGIMGAKMEKQVAMLRGLQLVLNPRAVDDRGRHFKNQAVQEPSNSHSIARSAVSNTTTGTACRAQYPKVIQTQLTLSLLGQVLSICPFSMLG